MGVGGEWSFWRNWSAFVEYDFIGFGSKVVAMAGTTRIGATPPFTFSDSFDIDQQLHVVKFGVNYRFGPAAPEPAAPAIRVTK